MSTRIPLVFTATAIYFALISCAWTEEEQSAREVEEVVMVHSETSFLQIAQGKYTGPNFLWLEDPNESEESVSDIEVGVNEINYTWDFRGKPQTGRMVFDLEPGRVEVEWVDTWHAAEGFKCTGTHSQSEMKFLCHYGPKSEPQWGWRTELTLPKSNQFLLEMYNITPQGQEQIAVRILADRVK